MLGQPEDRRITAGSGSSFSSETFGLGENTGKLDGLRLAISAMCGRFSRLFSTESGPFSQAPDFQRWNPKGEGLDPRVMYNTYADGVVYATQCNSVSEPLSGHETALRISRSIPAV